MPIRANENVQAKTPLFGKKKRKFAGHADAFDTLLEMVMTNLDDDNLERKVNSRVWTLAQCVQVVTLLLEVGANHWGYIHTGFEPKFIWAFIQVGGDQPFTPHRPAGIVRLHGRVNR
jgi:hypothetical protein